MSTKIWREKLVKCQEEAIPIHAMYLLVPCNEGYTGGVQYLHCYAEHQLPHDARLRFVLSTKYAELDMHNF